MSCWKHCRTKTTSSLASAFGHWRADWADMKGTTMKLEIYDTSKLKASLVCAAKDDVRNYLEGILVEVHAKHILLVSTNGHFMSVIRSKYVALHEDGSFDGRAVGKSFIIPRESIESFLKICDKGSTATIDFDTQPDGGLDRVQFAIHDSQGHMVEGKSIDGKYPDWRGIIPSVPRDSAKGPCVTYNASYVGDFGRIAKILGLKNQAVKLTEYYGSTFMVNITHEDFLGVLMGMKDLADVDTAWVE